MRGQLSLHKLMWWLTNQSRLRAEREAIEVLSAEWFQNPNWSVDNQLILTLSFEIVITRGHYFLRLIYHHTFPSSPPSIAPADGKTRLSGHQYSDGGDLCLEIRNDNWTPDVTGAMMIESAKRLLDAETPGDDGALVHAPSAHDFPENLSLRSDQLRFYVSPSTRRVMTDKNVDGLPIEVGIESYNGKTHIAHILTISAGGSGNKQHLAPEVIRETCPVYDGFVFETEVSTQSLTQFKTLRALSDLLGDRFELKLDSTWVVVLRGLEGDLKLLCHFKDGEDLVSFTTVVAPFDGNRSGIVPADINDKKVGIVGLGSLGSKIAVSLVRSGVRKFELVDGDILHTGNLERHDGDWRDVGRHKVDLTAHRLRLIRSDVETGVWKSAIGAQISSQEASNVSFVLASCDLIVDATANPEVFNYVAGLALHHNRSLIWGAVYAGGIGGEVARARINKDPSPYDIRTVINQYYETSDETPPIATGRGYDGSVGEALPLQATDADVSVVAAQISALALDALTDVEPSNFDEHAYLIGLKSGWLFSGPFDVRPIVVDAPVRNAALLSSETDIESEFIQSLFQSANSETSDTDTNN